MIQDSRACWLIFYQIDDSLLFRVRKQSICGPIDKSTSRIES